MSKSDPHILMEKDSKYLDMTYILKELSYNGVEFTKSDVTANLWT